MKLSVLVAASSGSVCISLGLCSSFSFGVEVFYSSDFDPHSNVQWIRNFKRSQLPTQMRYATETTAIQFLFSFTFRWIIFLNTYFRTPKKKPWTIAFGFFKILMKR